MKSSLKGVPALRTSSACGMRSPRSDARRAGFRRRNGAMELLTGSGQADELHAERCNTVSLLEPVGQVYGLMCKMCDQ